MILHMNIPIDVGKPVTGYCLHFKFCDGKQQNERSPIKVFKNVCYPSERIGKCSFDSVQHSELVLIICMIYKIVLPEYPDPFRICVFRN